MIYLLGGPPRVGKSKISNLITARHGISSVSTDSLGAVLENVLDPQTAHGLFAVSKFNELPLADRIDLMVEETRRRIDLQIAECRATWQAVAPFIRREAEEGRDVLVEGVAVLPELVARLGETDYRAVFVGHRGEDHEDCDLIFLVHKFTLLWKCPNSVEIVGHRSRVGQAKIHVTPLDAQRCDSLRRSLDRRLRLFPRVFGKFLHLIRYDAILHSVSCRGRDESFAKNHQRNPLARRDLPVRPVDC